MRLCLIGDSHAAMLIAAHRADPAGDALTIFAKPGLAASDIAVEDGILRAVSEDLGKRLDGMGTSDSLDLRDFDAIVIAGLVPSAFAAVRLQQGHAVSGWPSGVRALARALADGPGAPRPLMTRSAYRAALVALTENSLGATLARSAPCPVSLVPQPFPSDALLQMEGRYPVFRRVVRNGDGAALAEDLHAAYNSVFRKIDGASCLLQSTDTRSHGCLTRADLMRAGPRLAEGGRQESDDILHGNAALGAVLWAGLRQRLGTPVETTSNP